MERGKGKYRPWKAMEHKRLAEKGEDDNGKDESKGRMERRSEGKEEDREGGSEGGRGEGGRGVEGGSRKEVLPRRKGGGRGKQGGFPRVKGRGGNGTRRKTEKKLRTPFVFIYLRISISYVLPTPKWLFGVSSPLVVRAISFIVAAVTKC